MDNRVLTLVIALTALFAATPFEVRAGDLDLALSRLSQRSAAYRDVDDPSRSAYCAEVRAARVSDQAYDVAYKTDAATENSIPFLVPDNDAWQRLASQLGTALLPSVLTPARTGGPRGFDIGIETTITTIDNDFDESVDDKELNANYWRVGSEGPSTNSLDCGGSTNRTVAGTLTLTRLRFRKGLPLGLEVGASFGSLFHTRLWVPGVEVKLALLEGLRRWFVPELALRGAFNTAVGDSSYTLSAASFDVVASLPIVLGRVVTWTPHFAYQMGWIFAQTELVDLTPNVDAVQEGFASDEGHSQPFDPYTIGRTRMVGGMTIEYRNFSLAVEAAVDSAAPAVEGSTVLDNMPRQWTFAIAPTLSF